MDRPGAIGRAYRRRRRRAPPPAPPPPPPDGEEEDGDEEIALDEYFPDLDGETITYGDAEFRLSRLEEGVYAITKEIPRDDIRRVRSQLLRSSPHNPDNPNARFPNRRIHDQQLGEDEDEPVARSYCGKAPHLRRALILQRIQDHFTTNDFEQPFRRYAAIGTPSECFTSGRGVGSAIASARAGGKVSGGASMFVTPEKVWRRIRRSGGGYRNVTNKGSEPVTVTWYYRNEKTGQAYIPLQWVSGEDVYRTIAPGSTVKIYIPSHESGFHRDLLVARGESPIPIRFPLRATKLTLKDFAETYYTNYHYYPKEAKFFFGVSSLPAFPAASRPPAEIMHLESLTPADVLDCKARRCGGRRRRRGGLTAAEAEAEIEKIYSNMLTPHGYQKLSYIGTTRIEKLLPQD